jgi:hypothetical protein
VKVIDQQLFHSAINQLSTGNEEEPKTLQNRETLKEQNFDEKQNVVNKTFEDLLERMEKRARGEDI